MNLWFIIAVYTHNLSSCEIKAWKNSGLNGIQTHDLCKPKENSSLNGTRTDDLCDTGAVPYQLSCQAMWEQVTLWVHNIPVEGEGCKGFTTTDNCI